MNKRQFDLVEGSGNIFRDFDDPQADIKQAKATLAARIISLLDERGITVGNASAMSGFAAVDFARIRNADLGRLTIDELMRMLSSLDDRFRVTIHVELQQSEQDSMQASR